VIDAKHRNHPADNIHAGSGVNRATKRQQASSTDATNHMALIPEYQISRRAAMAVKLLALPAVAAVVMMLCISLGDVLPGIEATDAGASVDEDAREALERHARRATSPWLKPSVEWFYRQRLYGSGEVNIDACRLHAWRLAQTERAKQANTVDWVSLGPSNIAGRIRAIAFDPSAPATLYAGAASGGVLKSTDEGATWTAVTDAAPAMPIGALAVDPQHPSIIYAGTGEPLVPLSKAITIPAYAGVGVLKSTDAGATWTALPWPVRSSAVTRVLVHPVATDTLLVATRENLYRSGDGGQSWANPVLPGVITDIARSQRSPSVVFAAIGGDFGDAANGVYRSGSGGARFSWTRLATNFPAADSIGRIILATSPAAPGLLLALLARPIGRQGLPNGTAYSVLDKDFLALMRSTDDGDTWERLPMSLPADFALGQSWYNFAIAISPVNPDLLFVGGIEMYKSRDGGRTFSKITFGNMPLHQDQHVIVFQPGSTAVFVGNDGGVYRTPDEGGLWEFRGNGLETTQFYSVALDRRFPTGVFGGTQDNGTLRCTRPSRVWNTIRGDVDGSAMAVDSNVVYAMYTLSIFPNRSINGGGVWSTLNSGFHGGDRANWLQPPRSSCMNCVTPPIPRQRPSGGSSVPISRGAPRCTNPSSPTSPRLPRADRGCMPARATAGCIAARTSMPHRRCGRMCRAASRGAGLHGSPCIRRITARRIFRSRGTAERMCSAQATVVIRGPTCPALCPIFLSTPLRFRRCNRVWYFSPPTSASGFRGMTRTGNRSAGVCRTSWCWILPSMRPTRCTLPHMAVVSGWRMRPWAGRRALRNHPSSSRGIIPIPRLPLPEIFRSCSICRFRSP
jgi:photosystem II stability/assembly factor-like uncharacterized protein